MRKVVKKMSPFITKASLIEWKMSFKMKECSDKDYRKVSKLKMTFKILRRVIHKILFQLFSWKKGPNFRTKNYIVWSNSFQVFAKSKSQFSRRDDSWICLRSWTIWRKEFIFIKRWQKMMDISVDSVAKILKLEENLEAIFRENMQAIHTSIRWSRKFTKANHLREGGENIWRDRREDLQ